MKKFYVPLYHWTTNAEYCNSFKKLISSFKQTTGHSKNSLKLKISQYVIHYTCARYFPLRRSVYVYRMMYNIFDRLTTCKYWYILCVVLCLHIKIWETEIIFLYFFTKGQILYFLINIIINALWVLFILNLVNK